MELTDTAEKKVAGLLADEPAGSFLRISVRPGGCSGFSYEMFFDTAQGPDDVTVECGAVTVVIDQSSKMLLTDATLNYRDGLSGGFVIDNPAAQRTCGCGQSFS